MSQRLRLKFGSPLEKSPIKTHRFCVLPPLKTHPSKAIGFMYSPLWKITHQNSSVLCTPPFEKSPIKTHRFCVLPPLKNHCFWWALISGWAFISANTVHPLWLVFVHHPFHPLEHSCFAVQTWLRFFLPIFLSDFPHPKPASRSDSSQGHTWTRSTVPGPCHSPRS